MEEGSLPNDHAPRPGGLRKDGTADTVVERGSPERMLCRVPGPHRTYSFVNERLPYHESTQEGDVKTTVELLKLLTLGGADVNLQRNNGEIALHTAAHKGPLQPVWVLLLSNATHNIVDRRMFTPGEVAKRAGNRHCVVLLAQWPTLKLKYLECEFVQEWLKFLRDPDAQLDINLTAEEVILHLRLEELERCAAVSARGGHLLIDEVITGPILSSEQRAWPRVHVPPTDSVSVTSNAFESERRCGDSTSQSYPAAASAIAVASKTSKDETASRMGFDHRRNRTSGVTKKPTKSQLGKEIDVYLAEVRDANTVGASNGVLGESTGSSRLPAKMQLVARINRSLGRRDKSKNPSTTEGKGSSADLLGRRMTTYQRRRAAALEIAQDGGKSLGD